METLLIRFGEQQAWHIGEPSEIAAARRAGTLMAERIGFDDVRKGQLALLITEAATNIVKHAGAGELLLRALHSATHDGMEVIALDAGPGIADVERQMQDGHSSAGSYGVGLGAIERMSQSFEIYSRPGRGTALRMVIWADGNAPAESLWQLGAVCLAMPGETISGDDWSVHTSGDELTLMVADGLGHGPFAAEASRTATALVAERDHELPGVMLQRAHQALHSTRGAALAISKIEPESRQLRFAGIGNIAATLLEPNGRRHLISHNGIVGSNMHRSQEFVQPWLSDTVLLMHSDGIGTRWNIDDYPGLLDCHPGLLTAVLYRDFTRRRDDVSVVAVRQLAAGA